MQSLVEVAGRLSWTDETFSSLAPSQSLNLVNSCNISPQSRSWKLGMKGWTQTVNVRIILCAHVLTTTTVCPAKFGFLDSVATLVHTRIASKPQSAVKF